MISESMEMSCKIDMASLASLILFICTSHRGDSGKQNAEQQHRMQKRRGNVSGNLQQKDVFALYDRPKLTQLARAMPVAPKMPRTTTLFPRFFGFTHSDCHTGMVAVIPPTPIPATMRPTISWPRLKDEPCRICPMPAMMAATNKVHRRPKRLPIYVLVRAPARHPIV